MGTIKGKVYNSEGNFLAEADFSIEVIEDSGAWGGSCVLSPSFGTLINETDLCLILSDGRQGRFLFTNMTPYHDELHAVLKGIDSLEDL